MQGRHVPSWLLAQLTRVSCLQNHRLSDDDLLQAMTCLCGQSSVLRQAFKKINRKQSDLQEVASADEWKLGEEVRHSTYEGHVFEARDSDGTVLKRWAISEAREGETMRVPPETHARSDL